MHCHLISLSFFTLENKNRELRGWVTGQSSVVESRKKAGSTSRGAAEAGWR